MRQNIIRTCLMVAIALGVVACGQDEGPFSPAGHENSLSEATVMINGVQLLKAPVGLRLASATRAKMDQSGGHISVDGAILTVPSGALSGGTIITMANTSEVWAYDFGPDGLQFNTSATLKIKITQAELKKLGVDADALAVAYASGKSDDWKILGGTYDPVAEVITLPVDHFSRYSLCVE